MHSFLTSTGALLSADYLSVAIWSCGLDLLEDFKVISPGAARGWVLLIDLLIKFFFSRRFTEKTTSSDGEGPDWDSDESSVTDGGLGKFLGLENVSRIRVDLKS